MVKDDSGDALRDEIRARVCAVVREVLAIEGEIDFEASIVDRLAPESLDQVRLFMMLEDEFGGTIADEEIEDITTLSQVVTYIEKRVAEL